MKWVYFKFSGVLNIRSWIFLELNLEILEFVNKKFLKFKDNFIEDENI